MVFHSYFSSSFLFHLSVTTLHYISVEILTSVRPMFFFPAIIVNIIRPSTNFGLLILAIISVFERRYGVSFLVGLKMGKD